MRGHSGGEGRLTDMEMKSRGRQRYELFLHFLFVFTLQKKERVRPNKTFIIPGKLFNVFDIKRLKGGERDEKRRRRERESEWKREREREGCIRVDGGERWRSGRAPGDRGQEIRGKGVKGSK